MGVVKYGTSLLAIKIDKSVLMFRGISVPFMRNQVIFRFKGLNLLVFPVHDILGVSLEFRIIALRRLNGGERIRVNLSRAHIIAKDAGEASEVQVVFVLFVDGVHERVCFITVQDVFAFQIFF